MDKCLQCVELHGLVSVREIGRQGPDDVVLHKLLHPSEISDLENGLRGLSPQIGSIGEEKAVEILVDLVVVVGGVGSRHGRATKENVGPSRLLGRRLILVERRPD